MQFKVDYNYRSRVEALSQKYKKLTPVFNCNGAIDVSFELGNREVLISEGTGFNEKRYVYRYRQIKKIISFTDGLLVIFKDKKFVFLPVTDNEIADEDLVYIAQTFFEQMNTKFSIKGRLYIINYDSHNQKRKSLNLTLAHSPVLIIIVAVAMMLLGFVFTSMPTDYEPVSRDKCIAVTGKYESFEKDEDTIYLYFEGDDEAQVIDYSCYSRKLYTKISSLKTGDRLEMLLHPGNEYVVELVCDGKEILNLDFAQKVMYEDMVDFVWMGYIVIAAAVAVVVYVIVMLAGERAQKRKMESEVR